jgi:hypothetical protein
VNYPVCIAAAVTGMAGAFVDETATPRHAADDDATRP